MRDERGAQARRGRLRDHGELLEARAAQRIADLHSDAGEPFRPGRRSGALLEQGGARQVLRRVQVLPLPVGRAADRHRLLRTQQFAHRAGPVRLAEMDGGIEGLGGEIEGHEAHAEIHRRARMAGEEVGNAGNEPAGAEGRQGRKIQDAARAGERDRLMGGVGQLGQGGRGPARRTCAPHR